MVVAGLFFILDNTAKCSLIRIKNKNKTLQGCPTSKNQEDSWISPTFCAEIFFPLSDPNPNEFRLEIPKEMHKKETKIPSGPKLWDQFCGS